MPAVTATNVMQYVSTAKETRHSVSEGPTSLVNRKIGHLYLIVGVIEGTWFLGSAPGRFTCQGLYKYYAYMDVFDKFSISCAV